jgi:hypothetical protein
MRETFDPGAGRVGLTVVVYTAWNAVTGVVHPRGIARLSDTFNNWDDAFVPLESARFVDPASGQAEAQVQGTLLVPRHEILLIHEVSSGAAPSQPGGDEEMHVQKQVLFVQARLGPYRADGTMYLPQYATLQSYLNRAEETFLPLTNATIVSTVGERPHEVRAAFVLACRSRLLIREARVGGTVG